MAIFMIIAIGMITCNALYTLMFLILLSNNLLYKKGQSEKANKIQNI